MREEQDKAPDRGAEASRRVERESSLFLVLRRVVGSRQPAVLVMEPDGRVKRVNGRE